SGHGGCLATLHATYPPDTLARLETMAMMSDVDMPLVALRVQLASAVNIVVQTARPADGSRKITHITEVTGYDSGAGEYLTQDLFLREHQGIAADGTIASELVPTGVLPRCLPQLHEHGLDLPQSVYEAATRANAQ